MSNESNGEGIDDDPECPMIRIKKSTDARVRSRWKRAITFRVLGKSFPFAFIHRRIQKMWARTGGIKIGDIGNGCLQATFDSQLDHYCALYGGPWTIEDHYIALEPWRIDFDPDFDSISHAVWVRLPRLPLAYFDEEIMYDIGDKLGRVEKIDYNTANDSRGNYARICVEIDLRKRLISKYKIKRRVRRVEYEGLHMVCFGCGHYGHLENAFPLKEVNENLTPEEKTKQNTTQNPKQEIRPELLEDFGSWMIATRNRRKTKQHTTQKVGKDGKGKEGNPAAEVSGSRYNILMKEAMQELEDEDEEVDEHIVAQEEKEFIENQKSTKKDGQQLKVKDRESSKVKEMDGNTGKMKEVLASGMKEDQNKAGQDSKSFGGSMTKLNHPIATNDKEPTGNSNIKSRKGGKAIPQSPNGRLSSKGSGTPPLQNRPNIGNERGQASRARAGHQPIGKHPTPSVESKEKAKKKIISPGNGKGKPKKINFDPKTDFDPSKPEDASLPEGNDHGVKLEGRQMAMAIDS
ncbi:unnamed protein product [Linum trigynum]